MKLQHPSEVGEGLTTILLQEKLCTYREKDLLYVTELMAKLETGLMPTHLLIKPQFS